MMRIAIVTHTFPSVSETFIYNKVKELASRGHTLLVIASKQNKPLYDSLFIGENNVRIVYINMNGFVQYVCTHPAALVKCIPRKNRKQYLFNKYRLSVINSCKAAVVHFEFSGIAAEFVNILPLLKNKKIVSCRGSAEKVKLLVSNERKERLIKVFAKADAIHCVSRNMAATIEPYCADSQKIFINYPSINTSYFDTNRSNQKLETTTILSVGRLIFQKGYFIGLLAIQELYKQAQNIKWKIVAAGPLEEEMHFHLHQMELQDVVEVTGTQSSEAIKELMHQSDIFFLPSVSEGIANVVLEAMSMQMPVVSANCGGMGEVITNGKDGLLANVYDYQQLARQLLFLVNNPEKARQIGIAARERIIAQFTLQQQTDTFEAIYTKLINQ